MVDSIFFSLFAFVGLFLIWDAVKKIRAVNRLRKKGILTTGFIEKIEEFEDESDGETTITAYRLNIAFKNAEGVSKQLEIVQHDRYYNNIGLPVNVLYDPQNPDNFLINDPKAGKELGLPIFFLVFGIAMIAFCCYENRQFLQELFG